jgi:hypothetical protein
LILVHDIHPSGFGERVQLRYKYLRKGALCCLMLYQQYKVVKYEVSFDETCAALTLLRRWRLPWKLVCFLVMRNEAGPGFEHWISL